MAQCCQENQSLPQWKHRTQRGACSFHDDDGAQGFAKRIVAFLTVAIFHFFLLGFRLQPPPLDVILQCWSPQKYIKREGLWWWMSRANCELKAEQLDRFKLPFWCSSVSSLALLSTHFSLNVQREQAADLL